MATAGTGIIRSNFDTTPYHYQTTSISSNTWSWFYKSNVCFDVYYRVRGTFNDAYMRIDFYDYDLGVWVPYASDVGSVGGYGYQYRFSTVGTEILRFFHNNDVNWNDPAYTANTKIRDKTLTYNGHTYDTRGFSLWRIGFYKNPQKDIDFNINSYGPGYMTEADYNAVCKGRAIFCGGKMVSGSDDQHIVSGSPQDSDFNTRFLPSLFQGAELEGEFDRQVIPDWSGFRT